MEEEEEEGVGCYALCVGREEWDTARKRERRAGVSFHLYYRPTPISPHLPLPAQLSHGHPIGSSVSRGDWIR